MPMIDKDKLLKAIQAEQSAFKTGFPRRSFRLNDAINLIKDFPAVDTADVGLYEQVKCKDCKFVDTDAAGLYCTGYHKYVNVQPDDFCNYGERKDK